VNELLHRKRRLGLPRRARGLGFSHGRGRSPEHPAHTGWSREGPGYPVLRRATEGVAPGPDSMSRVAAGRRRDQGRTRLRWIALTYERRLRPTATCSWICVVRPIFCFHETAGGHRLGRFDPPLAEPRLMAIVFLKRVPNPSNSEPLAATHGGRFFFTLG